MAVITCPSCSTPAPPGAIFCDHCGYDLRTVAPAAQPMPPTFLVSSVEPKSVPCPVCQHGNIPGSAFCENCGAQITVPKSSSEQAGPSTPAALPTPPPVVPAAVSEPELPPFPPPKPAQPSGGVPGRLELVETHTPLPIPPGKNTVVLGREDPVSGVFPDIDFDPHGGHEAGVGRRHAQLILKEGQVYIEDLDSVNGTAVNRQRIPSHDLHPLNSGDEIRLGKLAVIYIR